MSILMPMGRFFETIINVDYSCPCVHLYIKFEHWFLCTVTHPILSCRPFSAREFASVLVWGCNTIVAYQVVFVA
jgi:hypothetical protein